MDAQVEILSPLKRIRRETLCTADEIAAHEYPGNPSGPRRIYCRKNDGTLIYWMDGNMICCDTLMLRIHKLLMQMFSIMRRPFTPQQVAACIPAFALFIIEEEPTIEEIERALLRVIENMKHTRH